MNTYNPNKALGAAPPPPGFSSRAPQGRDRHAGSRWRISPPCHICNAAAVWALSANLPRGTTTKPHRNLDEIERFFSADAARGIVLFRQTGHGPAALNPNKSFDQHGCDIFLKFTEGKLAHYLSSCDIVGMLGQLGALPAPGGRLGGAFVLSLLGAKPQ